MLPLPLALVACDGERRDPPRETAPSETGERPRGHSAAGSGTAGHTGRSAPPTEVWLEGGAFRVSVRDVDGDGAAELAVGDADAATVLTGPWRNASIRDEARWRLGMEGIEVALLPDLTGDGVTDLVMSRSVCSASVFAGPFAPGSPADVYAELPMEVGASFETCGDADGDGDEDLCLGSDPNCGVQGQPPVAFVFALPLPPAGLLPQHALTRISVGGEDVEVSSVDLDGDGRREVVVAAPGQAREQGAVWLFRDPPPGDVDVGAAAAAWTGIRRSQTGAELAHGDLDGDGREDLVVGAPEWGDRPADTGYYGGTREGRAFVLTSDAGGPVDGAPIALEASDVRGGGMGAGLAVGDLDGDGAADLVVSDPVRFPPGRGRVAIHLGPLASGAHDWSGAAAVVDGWGAGDNHGMDLALGDLDGDGRDDLAIAGSEPQDRSAVHLVFGAALFP